MTDYEYELYAFEEETGEKFEYENKIFKFSYLSKLLKIDERDKDFSVRLLNQSQHDISEYIGKDVYNRENVSDNLKEILLSVFIERYSLCKGAADFAFGDDIDDVMEKKFSDGSLNIEEFEEKFAEFPKDVQPVLDLYASKLSA